MDKEKIIQHIKAWLKTYCDQAGLFGFVIGISGGVDSALTSTLCALSGKKTLLLNMPIRQTAEEYSRAQEHIQDLEIKFQNVSSLEINLTSIFESIEKTYPIETTQHALAMANTRARLRMTTLYAIGQTHQLLVAGTGNKVEDFGIGFFTKFGDGGVDLSPIADLNKTQVFELAQHIGVVTSILKAKPTDGLFADGRSDEDQIGASYPELEWAMNHKGDDSKLNSRQKEVLAIYKKLNRINQHKMMPIPICKIPSSFLKTD
ncbi:MAG: NAD(+) synthase [Flavobacteriia bacterium]|nr:NAD(+) synthase [Flavobacteriia bacterium]